MAGVGRSGQRQKHLVMVATSVIGVLEQRRGSGWREGGGARARCLWAAFIGPHRSDGGVNGGRFLQVAKRAGYGEV